jgi:hypothetical protein
VAENFMVWGEGDGPPTVTQLGDARTDDTMVDATTTLTGLDLVTVFLGERPIQFRTGPERPPPNIVGASPPPPPPPPLMTSYAPTYYALGF